MGTGVHVSRKGEWQTLPDQPDADPFGFLNGHIADYMIYYIAGIRASINLY